MQHYDRNINIYSNSNIRFYTEFHSKNGMSKAKEISLISFKYDVIELCLLLLNVEI